MAQRDVIVMGCSAGGIEPLTQIVEGLPADLPAAVCIVQHFPEWAESALPRILNRLGTLPAKQAEDGETLSPGHIYVAPPGRHFEFAAPNKVRLTSGPRENGVRPAVDCLFRSAATVFGPRVVGVVLSGSLDDGSAGLQAIKRRGGVTIIQDPGTATFPGMPANALRAVDPDHVAAPGDIPNLLVRLVNEEAGEPPQVDAIEPSPGDLEQWSKAREGAGLLTCPDCGGTLMERRDGNVVQYTCHVGHRYSEQSMVAAQAVTLESAIYRAVRLMHERSFMLSKLSNRAQDANNPRFAERLRTQAAEVLASAHALVHMLRSHGESLGETGR